MSQEHDVFRTSGDMSSVWLKAREFNVSGRREKKKRGRLSALDQL